MLMAVHANLLCFLVNLRALETLLWVSRLGGFGAAARHLNLTQPAITRRMHELEQELGAPLFRREKGRMVFTAVGRKCLEIAERIVADITVLRVAAGGNAGISGSLRLGVGEVIALSWLDRLLVRLGREFPKVGLELDIDLSGRLQKKLGARRIDMAMLPGPVIAPGVITKSLGSSVLNWMSHPKLLNGITEVTPLDLVDVPIISLPYESNAHVVMQEWFREAGIRPRQVSYCNSFSVVASLVRKGIGISLLPPKLFSSLLDSGDITVLPETPRVRDVEYSVAYLPTSELAILPEVARLAAEEAWFSGQPTTALTQTDGSGKVWC